MGPMETLRLASPIPTLLLNRGGYAFSARLPHEFRNKWKESQDLTRQKVPNDYQLYKVWIDLPQNLKDTSITLCVCVCAGTRVGAWPRFEISWQFSQRFFLTIRFCPHPPMTSPVSPGPGTRQPGTAPNPRLLTLFKLANPKHVSPASPFFSAETTVNLLVHSSLPSLCLLTRPELGASPEWPCLCGFCVLPRTLRGTKL